MADNLEKQQQRLADKEDELRMREKTSQRRKERFHRRTRAVSLIIDWEQRRELFVSK